MKQLSIFYIRNPVIDKTLKPDTDGGSYFWTARIFHSHWFKIWRHDENTSWKL